MAKPTYILKDERAKSLYGIMQYMFAPYMDSITDMLAEYCQNPELILIIARGICNNIGRHKPEHLGLIKYKHLHGIQLMETITY